MPNYNEILAQSDRNVTDLKKQLKQFEQLHEDLQRRIEQAEKIPKEYQEHFTNIRRISERFINDLGGTVRKYFDGNNNLFNKNLTKLHSDVQYLDEQIVIFEKEVNRLKDTDLEKHFEKHQKTLSDIFQAINSINLQIGTVTSSLNRLEDSINNAKKAIVKRLDEQDENIKQHFENAKEDIFEQLDKQEILIQQLNSEIAKANELLSDNQKQISVNRIINVVSFVVIVVLLIFLILN